MTIQDNLFNKTDKLSPQQLCVHFKQLMHVLGAESEHIAHSKAVLLPIL